MMSDDASISKSRSVLRIMWQLFGNPIRFNLATFEMTFSGDRQNIKKAAKLLEHEGIWYRINWVHTEEDDYPNKITLQLDNVNNMQHIKKGHRIRLNRFPSFYYCHYSAK